MSLPNGGTSGGINWFWGVVLSVAFHVFIFLLIMFWGFGSSNYSAQPNFIEGRLVSLSELTDTEGNKEIKASQVKEEVQKQPKREEKKVVEGPKDESNKEKLKKVEKPMVEPKKAEKEIKPPPKAVKKEEKKEEPKKQEEQKNEEPKDKNLVALETKKEVKAAEKEPKPTKAPEVNKTQATKKKEKPDLENEKSKVLKDIQENVEEEKRRSVLEELQKKQGVTDEKVVAKANTTEKSERKSNSGRGQLGGSPLGGGTNAVVTNLFLERIRNEIRQHYKIPPNIPTDGKLETFVFFKINESGKVYDVRVNESSGNPAFDDLCIKAIYKSAPLTPPPPELMEQAKTVGFLIPFTNDPS
ncbi:MAG TPA: cell envelope integrity protein TolA [Thermodesulfobacteriota bacterium]